MNKMIRVVGVVAVGVSLLVASSAFARDGFGGGRGFYGGYRGGWGWGWGVYPAVSLGYGWPYYYNYGPGYYYPVYSAPAPVVYSDPAPAVYSSPTVNYGPQQFAQPPADYTIQPSAQAPSVQQQPVRSSIQQQSMTVLEIKALVKGGLSDPVILSQIRNNHAIFHLTTAEIIDLKTCNVSEQVIDFMINTASLRRKGSISWSS